MKDFRVDKFLGINNVDPAEKCKPGELQKATNVNITATGEVMTRDGSSRIYAGTPHSLFADGAIALFREGTDLKRFNPNYTATILRSGIIGNFRMAYLPLNGKVYFTDGVITGITDGLTSRSWGISVPPRPVLTQTVGNLLPGRYLAAVTHLRDDLEESGASESVAIDINQGGIQFTLPVSADPTVLYTAIYLTTCGGETLYRAIVVDNGVTSATYAGTGVEFRLALSTQFLSPPPAGHMMAYYNGRIYIADGAVVWHTQPYGYGLVNLGTSFQIFDSRITLLAPVLDGIWLATQNHTMFLAGKDPDEGFKRVEKAEYGTGALEGSQLLTTELGKGGEKIRLWIWASTDGICYGGDQGIFRNLSESKYTIPGTPSRAAAILNEVNEGSFYILSLI